jgi:hypothetical protein
VRVIACLAEGLGIRATTRVCEVALNTVLHWLMEAAEQLQAFTSYCLCDVHVTQHQLAELSAVIRALRNGELSEENALERLERSRRWAGMAIDPESKLLAIAVGPRALEMPQRVVHHVVGVLAPGCAPAWFSDGFKGYLPAIVGHCGCWVHPERRQVRGPVPKSRWKRSAAPHRALRLQGDVTHGVASFASRAVSLRSTGLAAVCCRRARVARQSLSAVWSSSCGGYPR